MALKRHSVWSACRHLNFPPSAGTCSRRPPETTEATETTGTIETIETTETTETIDTPETTETIETIETFQKINLPRRFFSSQPR